VNFNMLDVTRQSLVADMAVGLVDWLLSTMVRRSKPMLNLLVMNRICWQIDSKFQLLSVVQRLTLLFTLQDILTVM